MIVLDTSVIYALLDRADQRHAQAARWYRELEEELVTTPLVLAEVDHLAMTHGGRQATEAFRADVRAGAYTVHWWTTAATEAVDVAERYADMRIGLVDASLVALAHRVDSVNIATFDQRHFRTVRPLGGGDSFRLVPLDA